MSAATFAAVFVTLFVAHQAADHWVQTEWQAATKGKPGAEGRIACSNHVATYTTTAVLALIALQVGTGVVYSIPRVLIGLAVSALTHYIADRRTPLRRLAKWAGHEDFYRLGAPRPGRNDNPWLDTGAYALDQSWHYLWLFVAALIIGG